jgi:hypothetical protein
MLFPVVFTLLPYGENNNFSNIEEEIALIYILRKFFVNPCLMWTFKAIMPTFLPALRG